MKISGQQSSVRGDMSTGDLRRWTWWTGWTEWTHVTQHKGLMAMNSCCKMHHLQRGVLPPVFTPEECLWGKNRSEITMQNTVYPITSRVPPQSPPDPPVLWLHFGTQADRGSISPRCGLLMRQEGVRVKKQRAEEEGGQRGEGRGGDYGPQQTELSCRPRE